MRFPRLRSCLLLAALLPWPAMATEAESADKAQVLVMGTFHFANPGLDVVKSSVADVMSPASQGWLERLAARIEAFAPTDVLVECAANEQAGIEARLADYRAGGYGLGRNEIDQIGLRVARSLQDGRVTCFDQRDVQWEGDRLMGFLGEHAPGTMARLQAVFADLSAREASEQASLTLPALLRLANSAERERENRNLHLMTNAADAGNSYAGADAAASWRRRNFHMYGNVQKVAQPGRRVFVLAGAGHTAVIRQLLDSDAEREAVDVSPFLAD